LSIAALLAAAVPAAASECAGFVPENNLRIPVSPYARGIQEAQFHQVLDLIEKIYKPIVAERGAVLKVNRRWTDATVNASAQQYGGTYILNMYGGLARHETITMDGFALVACHELGHHLAGAPKVSSWASNEGQSDYYANMNCLKRVFADPDSEGFSAMKGSDEVARQSCAAAYSDPKEQAVCYRGAMAGRSVARLFKALRNETVDPGYDTPDTNVVPTMYMKHPGTQCRMDTYLAGSVCTQPVTAQLSETDPTVGTCTRSGGFATGFRPLCWYKPATVNELMPAGYKALEFNTDSVYSIPAPALRSLGYGEVF
jgi:hypothetical protein